MRSDGGARGAGPPGPPDLLAALRHDARAGAELLLALDPILGEPRVQRAVDAFVEQAADALHALARAAEHAAHHGAAGRPGEVGGGIPEWPRVTTDARRPSW